MLKHEDQIVLYGYLFFIIPSNEVQGGYRERLRPSVRTSVPPSVRPSVRLSVRAITQIPLVRFHSYFTDICPMRIEVVLESEFSKWPLVSKWRPFFVKNWPFSNFLKFDCKNEFLKLIFYRYTLYINTLIYILCSTL